MMFISDGRLGDPHVMRYDGCLHLQIALPIHKLLCIQYII